MPIYSALCTLGLVHHHIDLVCRIPAGLTPFWTILLQFDLAMFKGVPMT
jgi:hypothetical protein